MIASMFNSSKWYMQLSKVYEAFQAVSDQQ